MSFLWGKKGMIRDHRVDATITVREKFGFYGSMLCPWYAPVLYVDRVPAGTLVSIV
jgi:hypothetical protein